MLLHIRRTAALRISVLAATAAIAFFGGLRSDRPVTAQVLPEPAAPNQNSPHWSHINILDFARAARAIPDANIRNQAYAWLASHVDAMETSMDNTTYQLSDTLSTYLHSLNPTLKTFGYDYDLTMCQKANCYEAGGQPHPIFTNLPETYYLHVSEDTQVEFRDLDGNPFETITITGCPDPQPITASCRLQLFIWTQKRWVSNVQDTNWQTATADRFVQQLQTNSAGQQNVIDGLFIDEHGPAFVVQLGIGNQTRILSGGGIREYGGVRPVLPYNWQSPSALDVAYSADLDSWLTYLRTRLSTAGKFAHINVAEYFSDPLALDNSLAMLGAMTEHLNRPDSNGLMSGSRYQSVLDAVRQVVQAGGQVDFSRSWCNDGPAGYTPGNYPSSKSRYLMWSLASYYLAKEAVGDPGTLYFNPNLCIRPTAENPLDFTDEWLPAYQQNVGMPTGVAMVAEEGPLACIGEGYKVFSRQYENALILVRAKDGFNCNDYGDSTAVSIPLVEPMVMLLPDGTFSNPISSVSIRNAEAVILFSAPDSIPPAAILDLLAS